MKIAPRDTVSSTFIAALFLSLTPLSSAALTGKPVAYLGLGDNAAIPVIDSYDFQVNDAGIWNVEVGGGIRWSKPYQLYSQAQRRALQPLESKAVSPEYSIRYETSGTCSSDITVKDADTGEILVNPRNLNVGLWGLQEPRRIMFGLETYVSFGFGINCGQVSWSITTQVAHYTLGEDISDKSKQKSRSRRPPLIAIRSGFY